MFRSTLIYAPALLFTKLSALVLLVVATRVLDQDEYGLLTLVVTVGELVDSIVTNWLRIALLRLGGIGRVTRGSAGLALKVLTATTSMGVLACVPAALFIAPDRWQEFAFAVGAYLVVGSLARIALTLLQMQQRHATYGLLEFLRAVLQVALPIVAMIGFSASSFLEIALASNLATLIAGALSLVTASKTIIAGPPVFAQRHLLALGLPLIATALVSFGLINAERILLKVYIDAAAVAVFAAAYVLARQPVDTVANAINMGGFPLLVKIYDANGRSAAAEHLSRQLAMMGYALLPIAALLIAMGQDICELVLPITYRDAAAALFPLVVLGVLLSSFTSFVFDNVFHAEKRPGLQISSLVPGAVATIAASLILIPSLAAYGAAAATLIGAAVNLGSSVAVGRRLMKIQLPRRDLAVAFIAAISSWCAASFMQAVFTTDLNPGVTILVGGTVGSLTYLVVLVSLNPAFARTAIGHARHTTLQWAGRAA